MRLKKGVKLLGVKPELIIGLLVADSIWKEYGQELVVTSLVDGKHGKKSHHYKGLAADFRTNYFSDEAVNLVFAELKDQLDDEFDIVLEDTHIHIEYDPVN